MLHREASFALGSQGYVYFGSNNFNISIQSLTIFFYTQLIGARVRKSNILEPGSIGIYTPIVANNRLDLDFGTLIIVKIWLHSEIQRIQCRHFGWFAMHID